MAYNTDRRTSLSKKQRQEFLNSHDRLCYWCRQPILSDEWDVEHILAKELCPPGSRWDDEENKAPIHRDPCHKIKTAKDKALIAKSNRIRRNNGPVELRKKKPKIKSRPFQQGKRSIPSRPFEKRKK